MRTGFYKSFFRLHFELLQWALPKKRIHVFPKSENTVNYVFVRYSTFPNSYTELILPPVLFIGYNF